MQTNDMERLKNFDYGLARWYAFGYHRGYEHGTGDTCGPHLTDAERAVFKAGYDAGVADYSSEFDDERLST